MARYKRKLMSDINMVPFIDIVLVLLVAFMIAAPLMMQGVQVTLPKTQSENLQASEDKTLIISIKKDGTYYLNIDSTEQKAVSLEGILSLTKKIYRRSPGTTVLIRGDTQANYGNVVAIMAGLQQADITDIGLVTDPRDLR